MDMEMKTRFERLWARIFGAVELPLCFFYTGERHRAPRCRSRRPDSGA